MRANTVAYIPYVTAEDAGLLRQGLEKAFGRTAGKPGNGDGSGFDAGEVRP